MNNRKGTLENIMYSVLIASAAIALFYLMFASLASEYNRNDLIDENIQNTYNKLDNYTSQIGIMYNSLNDTSSNSIVDYGELFYKGTFAVINIVKTTIIFIPNSLVNISKDYGIPSPVAYIATTLLMAMLAIAIVFSIVNAMNRQKPL